LLRYENMPKAAQYLPDAELLGSDKGADLELCQCSGCGLVQLSNDPVPYYQEVIRASAVSEEMKKFRTKQFRDFVEKYYLQGKKVIEIGCGCGEFLSLMQQNDIELYGVEASEKSVLQCARSGLTVSKGFIQGTDYRLELAPFAAFFMLNFLEHLPDPNSTLSGIYCNLTDEALGLVEVPNFNMILRKNLFSEFIADHLLYFTRETLTTTLRLNGFDVIDFNEEWYDYVISVVVRKRKKLDLSNFYGCQAKLKDEIEGFIRPFGYKRVAVWGAGHQALAIISLLSIADKLKYVVDSATFKQGKFTPATHVPIVSPEKLNSDPVDALIVMAAGYADEVANNIRREFAGKMSIAILRDFGLEVF